MMVSSGGDNESLKLQQKEKIKEAGKLAVTNLKEILK
jgi:hypothetical protein